MARTPAIRISRAMRAAQSELFTRTVVRLSCGVDEAGRGPLAGPVFAAAVILNPERVIPGLADSKVLNAATRERLQSEIKAHCLAWAVAQASVEEIDAINILQASLLAMRRAVEALCMTPEEVVVDGLHCPRVLMSVRAVVGGDALVPQISAASILAKTARDALMCELHLRYPDYGFAQHKGYATSEHLTALRQHGASPVHRQSFAPVRAVLLVRD